MLGPRSRLVLGAIVAVAMTAWSGVTLFNAVRLGPRQSDPTVYWLSVALIAVATVALVGAAAWLTRKLRRI
jgi:hypothetical protein